MQNFVRSVFVAESKIQKNKPITAKRLKLSNFTEKTIFYDYSKRLKNKYTQIKTVSINGTVKVYHENSSTQVAMVVHPNGKMEEFDEKGRKTVGQMIKTHGHWQYREKEFPEWVLEISKKLKKIERQLIFHPYWGAREFHQIYNALEEKTNYELGFAEP
jgi:hypothetical protein